jgi:hypothetical protein
MGILINDSMNLRNVWSEGDDMDALRVLLN